MRAVRGRLPARTIRHPQPNERGVRDRERERRPERVERADEVHVAGEQDQDRADAREDDEREPGRLEARVEPAEDLRQLPVARHRVRDARGSDHPGVRGDEQDGGGEDPDVDLEPAEQPALDADVLDDPEDRVVREPALLGRQREQRRVLPVDQLHGQRRQGDGRQGEVDREDGERDELVRVRHGAHRVARLLGEVRDRLDPRVGEHRDRDRDREARPRRRHPPVDVRGQRLRAQHEGEAQDHEQHLGREVDHREADRELRRLRHPDDVERHERDDHDRPADDVPRVRAQRLPEDREVVRDEEGRDGDRDDVDEHLRPARDEADDLVEGVAREAGRAAGLREAGRALRVRRGGHREHRARDDEHHGRQPERVDRREAEGVVDRGADVPVRGGEQRGCAEHALHAHLAAPSAPGHRRSLGAYPGYARALEALCGPAAAGPQSARRPVRGRQPWIEAMMGMIRIATMLAILIIGLIAGPAVSL